MNIKNEIKSYYENECLDEVGKPMEIKKFISANKFSQKQIKVKEETNEEDGVDIMKNEMECIETVNSNKYELLDIDDCKITCKDDASLTYKSSLNGTQKTNCEGTEQNKNKSNSKDNNTIYLDKRDTFRRFIGSGKVIFKCNLCELQTEYRHSIHRHIRRQHETVNSREYRCTKSKYQIREEQLSSNDPDDNNINPYGCNICNKGFSTRYTLKNHILLHLEGKRFYCIYCNYKTHNEKYLIVHFEDKHSGKDKKYKCSQCQYQTNYKQNFNRHRRMHTVASNEITKVSECD